MTSFKVGDEVRHAAGSHVYTILQIKTNEHGIREAQVDPEYPEYWCNIDDLVKAKEEKEKENETD